MHFTVNDDARNEYSYQKEKRNLDFPRALGVDGIEILLDSKKTVERDKNPQQIISHDSEEHLRIVIADCIEGEMQIQLFDWLIQEEIWVRVSNDDEGVSGLHETNVRLDPFWELMIVGRKQRLFDSRVDDEGAIPVIFSVHWIKKIMEFNKGIIKVNDAHLEFLMA